MLIPSSLAAEIVTDEGENILLKWQLKCNVFHNFLRLEGSLLWKSIFGVKKYSVGVQKSFYFIENSSFLNEIIILFKIIVYCLVANLCPTLCDPMDYNPPSSPVHGISEARILEWVVISFSHGSSWPRDWTHVSCTGRWILYHWVPREACLK